MPDESNGNGCSRYIAIDMGAESARAIVGTVGDGKFELEELHRWPSRSTEVQGTRYWDFLYMLGEIKQALSMYAKKYGPAVDGIGVDSWGVDFGILGPSGQLLQNPVHYRDHRTDGMLEKAFEVVSAKDIYEETGLQFMSINTLYQLWILKDTSPEVLREGDSFLMISDLMHYALSGVKACEYTNASTTQLLDVRSRNWSDKLFDSFGLKSSIMPEILSPGTVLGPLDKTIADEVGLESAQVITPCTHDTACAVLAVPAEGDDWAYLSCGTWSLMGVELSEPITSEEARAANFTNEGGIGGTIRFLKNIMALWILQEARAAWLRRGTDYDYAELTELAKSAPSFGCIIDVDDPVFLNPDDMLDAIADHCERNGQEAPEGVGATVRTILEGIAICYAKVMAELEQSTGKTINTLHMVGGGIQNELLCQFAADATGKTVLAGPVEATAMGNIATQAIATGRISDAAAARKLVAQATSPKAYRPENQDLWAPIVEKALQK